MPNNREPLVSIGMTVHNQEMFIESAIASLLNQKYQNFELIISDNASDDRSPEICQYFARKDKRIQYMQNRENLGPNANTLNVLNAISGEFYMFASGHDLYHRDFISSLVGQYNRNDDNIILAYPDTVRIDRHGKRICNVIEDVDTRNLSVVEGFKKIVWGLSWCTPIYGLHRSSTFKSTWKMYEITGPDKILLPELSLKGAFVRHPELLFYMRQIRPAENYKQIYKRQAKWFVSNKYEAIVPTIMRDYELIKAVHHSKLNNTEKEELVEDVLRWHHADPRNHSSREVGNLVSHGMKMINSSGKSDEEKLNAAGEYLRIAKISRIFRPELAFKLDQIYELENIDHSISGGFQLRNCPLVSIGMAVFNQAGFLQKTIESLLAQEYQNFELIISDNASDDGSVDICEHYAKQDNRISFLRNTYNIGKIGNFDLVLNRSAGEFFLWSTGHDLFHPKYLSMLVKEFKANDDSVALCYPGIGFIDENDNLIQHDKDNCIDTRGMEPIDRFRKIIWNFSLGNKSAGLFRTSVIKQVWEPYMMRGPDYMIAAQLSLIGTIAQVNDQLFYKRRSRLIENQIVEKDKYKKTFSLSRYEAIIPYTMFAFEHINLVRNSILHQKDKLSLIEEIKKCFYERYMLQEEAISFLQKGVEWLNFNLQQLNSNFATVRELIQLSKICILFNSEFQAGIKKFSHLLENMVAN